MDIDRLIANFDALDALEEGWVEKYKIIVDMGRKLKPLADKYKIEKNEVHGCISRVWMMVRRRKDKFYFSADSDAFIVKGLIALIVEIYSGKTKEEIAEIDIDAIFTRLGLDNHLTINRRNGFQAMVRKIQDLANG